SVIQSLVALLQMTHFLGFAPSSQSGARADGTFGNATYLAVYMLFNIFITLFILARRRKEGTLHGGLQSWYGVALVLQLVTLYYTETRGAFYGALGGIILAALWIAVFSRGREHKALRLWCAYFLAALVVVGGIFFAARDTSFVQHNPTLQRFASLSVNDPTVQSRLLYIWPMAVKGIEEKPLVGWGQENFDFVFNKYY